jgi:hypothetical protein
MVFLIRDKLIKPAAIAQRKRLLDDSKENTKSKKSN